MSKTETTELHKNVKTVKTWKFTSLDYKQESLPQTLHHMVTEITWDDRNNIPRPLFLSMDQNYNKDGFIFTVHPEMEDEARVVTAGIYLYLKALHGDNIVAYFTDATVSAHKGHSWNSEKGGMMTAEDKLVGESDREDEWMDLSPNTPIEKYGEENLQIINTSEKFPTVQAGIIDTDSVGTIQIHHEKTAPNEHVKREKRESHYKVS